MCIYKQEKLNTTTLLYLIKKGGTFLFSCSFQKHYTMVVGSIEIENLSNHLLYLFLYHHFYHFYIIFIIH